MFDPSQRSEALKQSNGIMRCFVGECIKCKYCILLRVNIRQGSGLSYQDFYLASLKVLFDFRLMFGILLFWQPQGNTLQPAKFSRRFHKTLFTWFTKSGNLGWAPRRFLFSSFFQNSDSSYIKSLYQSHWLYNTLLTDSFIGSLRCSEAQILVYIFKYVLFAEVNFASTASLNQYSESTAAV